MPRAVQVPSMTRKLLNQTSPAWQEVLEHGWNPADCSANMDFLADDPLTVKRRPVPRSTDGVRGRQNYTRGVHAWEIRWPRGERGSHAIVGVSNDQQVLHCAGYSKLVGSGLNSWGWHMESATAYHDGKGTSALWQFPPSKEFSGIDYPKPGAVTLDSFDTMIMVLDLEAGTLAYMVNNIYLGTAFSGLRGPLYPIISCTWGDAEISLIYR